MSLLKSKYFFFKLIFTSTLLENRTQETARISSEYEQKMEVQAADQPSEPLGRETKRRHLQRILMHLLFICFCNVRDI